MRAGEVKRMVGYQDLTITESCGSCGNCLERGNHLRCAKHGFAVTSLGICRSGYRKGNRQRELQFPLVRAEHYRVASGAALNGEGTV